MEQSTSTETLRVCVDQALRGLQPPPNFTVSEWSDNHRVLPAESSDEAGQWRTSRTPYLREIMDELSPKSHAEDVVFMKGSQLGATETLINAALFYVAHCPCPILLIEPTITVSERFSKQRLQPSIRACPQVREKMGDPRSRASGNTTLEKDFPGGVLIIGGANSAASMRSMPIRVALFDEIDGYPADVDGEGDPVDLGERRTTNFSRRKRFYISTPTVSGMSRIEKRYEESDKRQYFVPCPHCKEMQVILWANIKFADRDPSTAHLVCTACGKVIKEHNKTWMLENGEWRRSNPSSEVPGFHISALYSPLGWYSWQNAVSDHLKALGNPNKRKVWTNTVLGEVWDEAATSIDATHIRKRVEKFNAPVPAGVLVLLAGVDTQDNRLEVTTIGAGWNVCLELWVIEHAIIHGDPGNAETWQMLDQHLSKNYVHENGTTLHVGCTAIDAMGHNTDMVYSFCAQREFRRVFPIQGKGGAGRPIVSRGSRQKRHKVYLFQVGVDSGKDMIYSRLKIEEGPGKIHFPDTLDETYFAQLTSEKRITEYHAGLPRSRWVLPQGRRNETLDCFVYSLAALNILNPNLELMAAEETVYGSDTPRPIVQRGRRVISKGVQL
jgi:phage terminase large subunit GpA-like protein